MEIHFKGEPNSENSFFANYFKDEPKRKLITLFGNKRKKLVKSKHKKRFIESKHYVPKLIKKIKGTVSKHQVVIGKTSDGITTNSMKDIARQSRRFRAIFPEPTEQ